MWLKKNEAKPAAKTEDDVSRSCTPICKQVNQPSNPITGPLMDLPPASSLTTAHATPILLDKSDVPRGQMLPVCQDQCLSASFQSVENNWMVPTSVFKNPTFNSAKISRPLEPQMGPHPSSSHALWDATPGLVGPVDFPAVSFGQAYSPHERTTVTHLTVSSVDQVQIDSPLVGPSDSDSLGDLTKKPLIPSPVVQSTTLNGDGLTAEGGNEPACDSGLLQEKDPCSNSPQTDRLKDVEQPSWLDLLLDTNGNLCFPDANLVNMALSPYTGCTK